MNSFFKTALLIAITTSLTACAGMGGHFDAERAPKVKTVAIIGYEILQEMPSDTMGIAKISDAKDHGGIENSPQLQLAVKNAYNDLALKLGKNAGWQVMNYEDITTNKTYAMTVKDKMSGIRSVNMMGVTGKHKLVVAKNMLDVTAFRKMKLEDRAAMAKALHVDAVAELMVIQTISEGFSMGLVSGDGPFDYTTRINFAVFEPTNDTPVWRVNNVDGQKTSSKALPKETIRIEKIAKTTLTAAQSANSNLASKYPATIAK